MEDALRELMGKVDSLLNEFLNNILHHPRLQRLEASWRALFNLCELSARYPHVKLKLLNISEKELNKDLTTALDFDQSELFTKIYHKEIDLPGGEPFGVLIADYAFTHRPQVGLPDGIGILSELSKIGAASFCPIITTLAPSFFGLDSFKNLDAVFRMKGLFKLEEYKRWQGLRNSLDSRFLSIVLPRALVRLPYNAQGVQSTSSLFEEKIDNQEHYLWGSAAYPYVSALVCGVGETSWFLNMPTTHLNANTVPRCRLNRPTPQAPYQHSLCCDYQLTDSNEKDFAESGFISLKDEPLTHTISFYTSLSVFKPGHKHNAVLQANYKLSSLLHYTLCASRFAHYLKVIMRNKVGSFTTPDECQAYLRRWIHQYTSATHTANETEINQRPLREALIKVKENPSRPGSFYCDMQLKPHFHFDDLQSSLKFVTHVQL